MLLNKTASRVVDILNLIAQSEKALVITEISKALNIYKSNVHNVLITLAEKGFVIKDSKTDKYKQGRIF
jgi:DNA-binding IclR family transcriptional regulator